MTTIQNPSSGDGGRRIDAHHHLWKFDPARESWITDEMAVIKRDFLWQDFQSVLQKNGIDGSVLVQTDQSERHNEFLLNCAAEADFIKGVVGWTDLRSQDLEQRLDFYSQFRKMKGFRHVLQGETERAFMLKPDFMSGIRGLEKFGFTYDILIYPDQLKYVPQFASAFPGQKFIIDHIAKPEIRNHKIDEWRREIREVAKRENVWCKISGMVTEASWKSWKQQDFVTYMDVIVEAFGIKRIIFGSDWPVCLVAASYEEVLNIVQEYFSSFSESEQQLFFGGNATEFYNL